VVLWLDVHLFVCLWDTIQLSAAHPPLDPEDSAVITAHLERKVRDMLQQHIDYGGAPAKISCVVQSLCVRSILCFVFWRGALVTVKHWCVCVENHPAECCAPATGP
jgi:type IV secretory pathway TrbD component